MLLTSYYGHFLHNVGMAVGCEGTINDNNRNRPRPTATAEERWYVSPIPWPSPTGGRYGACSDQQRGHGPSPGGAAA
jgi:hypothetical protein